MVRRERLELSVRRLRGDCFTRLAYGARRIGGADETRTRGLPIDSRALYTPELQLRFVKLGWPVGFEPDNLCVHGAATLPLELRPT